MQEAQKKALKVTVEPGKGAFIVTDPKGFSVTVTMTSKAMEADATAASITGQCWDYNVDRHIEQTPKNLQQVTTQFLKLHQSLGIIVIHHNICFSSAF